MRLSNILKKKPFCNDIHLIAIPLILFILSFRYWYISILLIIYIIFILRRFKLLIPITIIICLSFIVISYKSIIKSNISNGSYKGKIVNQYEDYYIINIKNNNLKIYDKSTYTPGDIINVDIHIYPDKSKSYENDIDYTYINKSKNISYTGYAIASSKIKSSFSLNYLKYKISNYLKSILSSDTYSYVSSLIFAENLLSSEIKEGYSHLGISHILAISGMHITILYNILSFILLKLFKYYKSNIQIAIITCYIALISFPISCTRALLFLILSKLNTKGKIKYTNLDILCISLILMLIINPYYIYSNGFILSYLVSFVLIYSRQLINTKSKLLNNYLSYYLIVLVTLPFVINMTNSFDILSLLLSPILSIIISYITIPICYLVSLFPALDYIFKYYFILLNNYIINLSNIGISFNIRSIGTIPIIIYFIIISLMVVNILKKKSIIYPISLLSIFIICNITILSYKLVPTVTFLDVGQGDSCVIEDKYNKSVIVIDAYNSYNYLKKNGYHTIDYLVITHSDDDHSGDYKRIIDDFNVKKILLNKYEDKIKVRNSMYLSSGDNISINNININVLSPNINYNDDNKNSLVLKVNIYKYSFLFCADIDKYVEEDIIGLDLKSDVIKIAHHGANTSSSINFINKVNPKYCIISAGINNRYGHPHKSTLSNLYNRKVLITYETGNITFLVYKNSLRYQIYKTSKKILE